MEEHKRKKKTFAIVSPLANEAETFEEYTTALQYALDDLEAGEVFFVVDNVSKDNTLDLCNRLENTDRRFHTVFAPENRNVVDAYLRGYREALKHPFDYIIEMDGGMSHNPAALPQFIRCLNEGHKCVFGSRFINGGSIYDSNWRRTLFSRGGTILSNLLLGTHMRDMTSGYMGFHADVARKFVEYGLLSKAHFYQTEVRYLLRYQQYIEVPVHYIAPSPSVRWEAVRNSFAVLFHYFFKRITGRPAAI